MTKLVKTCTAFTTHFKIFLDSPKSKYQHHITTHLKATREKLTIATIPTINFFKTYIGIPDVNKLSLWMISVINMIRSQTHTTQCSTNGITW